MQGYETGTKLTRALPHPEAEGRQLFRNFFIVGSGSKLATKLRFVLAMVVSLACTISQHAFAQKNTIQLTAFDTFRTFESVYPDRQRGLTDFPWDQSTHQTKYEEIRYFASRLAILNDVPYVWGGGSTQPESPSACQQCKECIETGKYNTRNVFTSCRACQSCGIDCSHLVNQVLRNAGMRTPYGSTEELLSRSVEDLERLYQVIDIPARPAAALPGDLLVFGGHVVLLLNQHGDGSGTVVHSAAYKKDSTVGGIAIEDIDLAKYAGGMRRILRHRIMYNLGFDRTTAVADHQLRPGKESSWAYDSNPSGFIIDIAEDGPGNLAH